MGRTGWVGSGWVGKRRGDGVGDFWGWLGLSRGLAPLLVCRASGREGNVAEDPELNFRGLEEPWTSVAADAHPRGAEAMSGRSPSRIEV